MFTRRRADQQKQVKHWHGKFLTVSHCFFLAAAAAQVNKLFIYSGGQLKFPTWNELNPGTLRCFLFIFSFLLGCNRRVEIQISKDQEPPSIDVLWTTNPSAMDELGQVIRDSKAWEDDSLVDLLLS